MARSAVLKRKPFVFGVRFDLINFHVTLVTGRFLMSAGQCKSGGCMVESNILLPIRKFMAAVAGCVKLAPVFVLVTAHAIPFQPKVGVIQILGRKT